MSADESHSLADQAAAWVPPWARQPSPSETQAPEDAAEETLPAAEAELESDSHPFEEPTGALAVEQTVVDVEPFTAGDVPANGRPGDPLEAQQPDQAVDRPADISLEPDESDISAEGSTIEATDVESSEVESPSDAFDQPPNIYPYPDESDMSGTGAATGAVGANVLLREASAPASEVAEPVAEPVAEHAADPTIVDSSVAYQVSDNAGEPVAEPTTEPTVAEPTAADPTGAHPTAADQVSEQTADLTAAESGAAEQVGEQTALPIEAESKIELTDEELRGAVEAILLIVDEPVTEIILAQVLDQPVDRIAGVLDACSREYAEMGRGFELRRIAGGWRLYTRSEYAAYVEKFVLDGQQVRLTQAALETLAVVAYKQPVTRSRISAIRGVNCDGVVRTLVARGLIEECGSEPESGAFLYRTTTLFLEKLGLDSVEQLPPLAPFLPDDVDEIADAQR